MKIYQIVGIKMLIPMFFQEMKRINLIKRYPNRKPSRNNKIDIKRRTIHKNPNRKSQIKKFLYHLSHRHIVMNKKVLKNPLDRPQ